MESENGIIIISGIVLLVFLLFRVTVVNALIYWRLKKRVSDMGTLANELGLSYKHDLRSILSFSTLLLLKDWELTRLEGKYRGHDIVIADIIYGGLLNSFGSRNLRRTRLIIDGNQIPNTPPLGFNETIFSPIAALRDHLNRFVK
jgi:hypothetical protein